MKPKVYLCGPINGQTDEQCKCWRNEALALLKDHFFIIDPMDRDYRGKEMDNHKDIVENDLRDIGKCHYILANCERPSWGTAMEIALAASMRPLTFAFNAGANPSPWLVYHTFSRSETLRDACSALISCMLSHKDNGAF